jgi:hypothetical protein
MQVNNNMGESPMKNGGGQDQQQQEQPNEENIQDFM